MIFKNKSNVNSKTIRGIVIGIIIGGIVFGGMGVVAVTLTADQIKYTPSNENFKVTNVEEALDEIYKIAGYEIPADTYFYEQGTEGDSNTIVRYKKINNEYFICDSYGKVDDDASAIDVTDKSLIPYVATTTSNLGAGAAGFASNSLILGDGSNSTLDGKLAIIYSHADAGNGSRNMIPTYYNNELFTVSNDESYKIIANKRFTLKSIATMSAAAGLGGYFKLYKNNELVISQSHDLYLWNNINFEEIIVEPGDVINAEWSYNSNNYYSAGVSVVFYI